MGEIYETKWIKHDEPIPEGWALAANEGRMRDRHSHYGRMIVREVKSFFDNFNRAKEDAPGGVE